MAKMHLQWDNETETRYVFVCLGCGNTHWIRTKGQSPVWTLTGLAEDRPTIRASILVWGTLDITDEQVARIMAGEPFEPVKYMCHAFVTDGRIQYLGDCTHKLANKTIELPDFEKWVAGEHIDIVEVTG